MAEITALNEYYLKEGNGSLGRMMKTHFYCACKQCLATRETDPLMLTVRFYTTLLRHLTGDHSLCAGQCGDAPRLTPGGAAHKAIALALKDFTSEPHLRFYLRGRESCLNEAIRTVYIKYASKRIFWWGYTWTTAPLWADYNPD